MMQAVRGVYRSGAVELLEKPAGVAEADVVVTFLPARGGLALSEDDDAQDAMAFAEDAAPLDDFEPIFPAKPGRLSNIVLEGRR